MLRRLRQMPTGWGPLGRELLLVVPCYTLISLVVTYPLVLDFTGCIIGDLESDVWKHLWGMWWVRYKILEEKVLPLATSLLNYPYGGALFFIDPLNGLLSVPLQLLWDPPVAYNALVLFEMTFAATGAYCLGRHLTGNPRAAFVAGVIYGFSSYLLAYTTSGVTEALNVGYLPFFALFFLRLLRRNRTADAVRAGVAFALAALGSWYYGFFCGLLAAFLYLHALLRFYRRPLRILARQARERLRLPWSRGTTLAAGIAAFTGLAFSRLPAALHRFQADPHSPVRFTARPLDVVLVLGSVMAAGVLFLHLQGVTRDRFREIGRSLLALGLVLLAGLEAGVLEAAALLGRGNAALAAGALPALLLAAALLWWRRDDLLRTAAWLCREGRFLLALGLFVLAGMGLWSSLRGAAGGGRWAPAGLALAFALAVLFLARSLGRAPSAAEEPGLLDRYRRFLRDHFALVVLLSVASLPWLRRVLNRGWGDSGTALPELPAILFLPVWVGVLALLQLGVAALRWLWDEAGKALRREGIRGPRWSPATCGNRFLLKPMVSALVGLALIAAPAVEFRRTLNREVSLVYRRQPDLVDLYLSRRFANMSRLVDYLRPGKGNATRTYTVDRLTRASYAGWVTLALAGWGLLRVRRRFHRFWGVMAAVFVMFSLGPFCYLTDRLALSAPSPVYMAFYSYFPFFSQISIPYRFHQVAMLCFALLAAYALAESFRRRDRAEQVLAAGAVGCAVLLEVLLFSPAPWPIPRTRLEVPEFYRRLAQEEGFFGILDLPVRRAKGELLPGEYFYYQVIHQKGIPNKVEGTIPVYVYKNPFTNYLFVLEQTYLGAGLPSRRELARGVAELARFRFRYLVVHDNSLRAHTRARLHALLEYFLGEPTRYAGNLAVYQIPPELRRGFPLPAEQEVVRP